MVEMKTVAMRVRQHWLSQGLRVSPVESEQLTALKQARVEGIPEPYEEFVRIAGLPGNEDREGFRFWLPQEIRATRDVLEGAGHKSKTTESSIIIADYLQESWWYALWLTGPFKDLVSLVLGREDGDDPQSPLGTLAEFLTAYLQDDARLYPADQLSGA